MILVYISISPSWKPTLFECEELPFGVKVAIALLQNQTVGISGIVLYSFIVKANDVVLAIFKKFLQQFIYSKEQKI